MNTHYPTPYLRWINEPIIIEQNEHCSVAKDNYVLQQLWESQYYEVEDEWRDIPVEVEG